MRRESRGHYSVEFRPIAKAGDTLAEGEIIQRYAKEIEALTRERPADWFWNYRRWKVQRDADGNPRIVKSGEIKAPP